MNITLVLIVLILLILLILISNNNKSNIKGININLKTYKDLLIEYNDSVKKTIGGIPKIIIKTSWQQVTNLPVEIIEVLTITARLNPDYSVYYFDDNDVERFMKDYGIREYNAYKKITPGAFKADLFRYCLLYKYGGCYSDIGHVMLKSFDYIIGDNTLVIVKDNPFIMHFSGIHNALLCSTKNNEFMKLVINKTIENIENNYYGNGPLDITGPEMMGKVYQCYYKDYCNKGLNEINFVSQDGVEILYLVATTNGFVIKDKDKEILLKTKFDNYNDVQYGKQTNKVHYGVLWHNRKVYRE